MTAFRRPTLRRLPRNSGSSVAIVLLAGALVSAVSCGPNEVVTRIPEDHDRLKAIATVYAYACRDLGRPPKSSEELMPIFERAGIKNPQDDLLSTRDGKPYVIIWGLDLEGQFLGSELPLAYEKDGHEGRRFMVTCCQALLEVAPEEFLVIDWPLGHEPEL